ncbi:MAG TPA: ROK family protein [Patescibacteria group bacterium]|jgi:polyphosphate glucokinase|nr:ROK family protein [Patescibacteria group bacterium]
MDILGIDIGGSGIKGAFVNVKKGKLSSERVRIPTPQPALPDAINDKIGKLVKNHKYDGPIGVGFPAIIQDGVVRSAANVAEEWIGYPGAKVMSKTTGCQVTLLNDADAAGIAEMRFGAGKKKRGVVIVLTLGTGIGSSLFADGKLVPNTELGHLFLRNSKADAEDYASDRIRAAERLTWKNWAVRLDEYIHHLEFIFSPTLIILGGGVSKRYDKFIPHLTVKTRVVPAQLRNEAGIVGAAIAAVENIR